jgi:CMP/dCMP kinase
MAVITISRLYGSGARSLATNLAKKLGYTFWDKEILKEVAERSGVSPGEVVGFERYGGSSLMRLLEKMVSSDYISRFVGEEKGVLHEKRYVELVRDIITEIYLQDNAVILGRGGQFILADKPGAYHVLLGADAARRTAYMAKNKDSDVNSREALSRLDQRRLEFLSCFGEEGGDNPGLYHLCLNTGMVSEDKGIKLILELIS